MLAYKKEREVIKERIKAIKKQKYNFHTSSPDED